MDDVQPNIELKTELGDLKIVSHYNTAGQPDKVILTVFDVSEGQYVDIEITSQLAALKRAIETHEHGLRDF